jgi:hypothetical protein
MNRYSIALFQIVSDTNYFKWCSGSLHLNNNLWIGWIYNTYEKCTFTDEDFMHNVNDAHNFKAFELVKITQKATLFYNACIRQWRRRINAIITNFQWLTWMSCPIEQLLQSQSWLLMISCYEANPEWNS